MPEELQEVPVQPELPVAERPDEQKGSLSESLQKMEAAWYAARDPYEQ